MGKSRRKDLLIFVSILIVTIVGVIYAVFLFRDSFNSGEEITLNYVEDSALNYKVWLKNNDFYLEEYLDENYDVVASAIDEIEIDFDYKMALSDYIQGSSYYTINSRIVAFQKGDSTEKKIWDYNKLIKDKVITVYDVDTLEIKNADNIKIDYQHYRTLMDNYKKNYGVSLEGNLIIEIDIKSNFSYSKFENVIDLNNRKMIITVSLTDSSVRVTKQLPSNGSQNLVEKEDSRINYLKLSLSLFAFLWGLGLCVFLGVTLVKIVGIDSKYNRELKRILRTYDSIIVNVKSFKYDDYKKIIYVDSINELLDAQQELRKPILFYNIKPNKTSLFAIGCEKEVFVYKMQSTLYEKNK